MQQGDQPPSKLREYAVPAVVIAVLTLVSVLLHSRWCGTPMQAEENRWRTIVEYHTTFYPFSIRYFTTYVILGITNIFGTPLRETFFVVQYSLMAAVGMALYRFLRVLQLNRIEANVGLALFMLSFPILFAHSEPVFTWDDPWTYLFLLLCTMALIRQRLTAAAVYFTLGCFAREQMLFYYPAYLLGMFMFCRETRWMHKVLTAFAPLVVYGAFYAAVFQPPHPKRYELLAYNFATYPRAVNSLFSVFISFGALWAAWYASLHQFLTGDITTETARRLRYLAVASILGVVPTLVVGIVFTLARETRIFFPPFVYIIPLVLFWFRYHVQALKGRRLWWRVALLTVGTVLFIRVGLRLAEILMPDLDYRNCPDFCHLWSGIHVGLALTVLLFALIAARRGGPIVGESESRPS